MNRLLLTKQLGNIVCCYGRPILNRETSIWRQQYPRFQSLLTNSNKIPAADSVRNEWNRAVSEAERVVGYPTSFLSLRWILNDEIANTVLHMRKLVASSHPLAKTSSVLFDNATQSVQLWTLIILLISKVAGAPLITDIEEDERVGVLNTQRGLAAVTEMIRNAQLVHNSLVNLQKTTKARQDPDTYEDMIFGNKIGLLVGDYILSKSSMALSKLRNQEVVGLISSAIRDLSEAEFIGDRDEQNNPLPFNPHTQTFRAVEDSQTIVDFDDNNVLRPMSFSRLLDAQKDWEVRNTLSGGSLLGKSCLSAMKLAKQSDDVQKMAFLFGKHFHLAMQAGLEADQFETPTHTLDDKFSLVSAPVLFHLEHDPMLYSEIEKGKVSIDEIDYLRIYSAVRKGPGLEKTKKLQRKHMDTALHILETLPNNDANLSLKKIVNGMAR